MRVRVRVQTVLRYTAPLPLTAELYNFGSSFYTRATCIPEGAFQGYKNKIELVGNFTELDTIGTRAFARKSHKGKAFEVQPLLIKSEFPMLRCVVANSEMWRSSSNVALLAYTHVLAFGARGTG